MDKLCCSYTGYECSRPRFENYRFCFDHILNDKSAPFRQCSFVYPNAKRCYHVAFISGKKGATLCADHIKEASAKQFKSSLQLKPADSPELCLNQLSHHIISKLPNIQNAVPDLNAVPSIASLSFKYDEPAEERVDSHLWLAEDEPVGGLPRAEDDFEDFIPAVDGEDLAVLDNAEVVTAQEASRIYIQKVDKLTALYKEEMKRLRHLLRENRRRYLREANRERATMTSIHAQPKENSVERSAYSTLKALARKQRCNGAEAIMRAAYKEKRDRQSGETSLPAKSIATTGHKCVFAEGSWKCGERAIPQAKFCFKHILHDDRQVLYVACSCAEGGSDPPCPAPVAAVPTNAGGGSCVFHRTLPDETPVLCASAAVIDIDACESSIIDLGDGGAQVMPDIT